MLDIDSQWRDVLLVSDYDESARARRFTEAADDRVKQAVLWDSMALDD